jgi:hypothetical protein
MMMVSPLFSCILRHELESKLHVYHYYMVVYIYCIGRREIAFLLSPEAPTISRGKVNVEGDNKILFLEVPMQ